MLMALLFIRLSPLVEAVHFDSPKTRSALGLHRSRGVVLKLSTLFGLDAFAGGFVVESLVAYWFHVRFGVEQAALGGIFFGANILAGISALACAWVAARIGLVNTMVFTPPALRTSSWRWYRSCRTFPSPLLFCCARFSVSQMDVPPRQSYTIGRCRAR